MPPTDHSLLRRAAIVVGFNTLVGIGLVTAHGGAWDVQIVYAQAIGLCIWGLVEAGHEWLPGDPSVGWPQGWRLPVLIGVGVPAGFVAGTWIGDRYSGVSSFTDGFSRPGSLLGYLVLTIAISTGVTYFFVSRGRDRDRTHLLALARRDAAEAKLQLLTSQLEPHMLFNTLANLRVLIDLDPPRAQVMLDQLIAFLRSTLTASRAGGTHPLADEFARLADYLGLMQVRMGDRLQVVLDLPPALQGQPVAPMLLQPLVENAVKHGLEPHLPGGRLVVSAAAEGGWLVLRVRDTGVGIGIAAGGPPAQDGTHVGIQLVRDRLHGLHGRAGSLELAPADDADGGTLATIRMPLEPLP